MKPSLICCFHYLSCLAAPLYDGVQKHVQTLIKPPSNAFEVVLGRKEEMNEWTILADVVVVEGR